MRLAVPTIADDLFRVDEAMKTERRAAETYRAFLEFPGVDPELHDAIEQIYFQEERAVEELRQLMDS